MSGEQIGLIGVGLLGTAVLERLLGGRFRVVAYDVRAERRDAAAALGGTVADTPHAVLTTCQRIFLSLPTSQIVEGVFQELSDTLRPGLTFLDTTTGDPLHTEALARRLDDAGVSYLDATVSGSSEQARAGDVVLMVGGREAVFEANRDLLTCLARQVFYLGPWGTGARMKLVSNLVLGLNRAVLAEGLAFAEACGVDPAQALEVLRAGAASSRVMDTKGRKMVERDYRVQARLAQHLKDVGLILAEGERTGAHLPLSTLHRDLLTALVRNGHGDEDNSVIREAFPSQIP